MRATLHTPLLFLVLLFVAAPLRAQDTRENADFKLAVNLYKDGLYQAAEDQFKVFIEKYPATASGIEARYYLGMIQFRTRKYRDARATFQDFAIRFPDDLKAPDAWWQAAECFVNERNYAEAASLFARLKTFHPKSRRAPEALLEASRYFLKVNDIDNARIVLNALLSEYPESEFSLDAEYQLGLLRTASGEYERALAGLRRVSENGTRDDLRAQALVAIGVVHSLLGDRDAAEARFREVTTKYPGTPAAFDAGVRMADLQRRFRRNTEASASYLAVARDTAAPAALRQEAYAGAAECASAGDGKSDPAAAARIYAEMFTRFPDETFEPALIFHATQAMQDAGDYAGAGARLEGLLGDTVIAVDKRRVVAALARNAARGRNFNDAVRWYQRYAREWPADEGVPYALYEIASITEREFRGATRAIELYNAVTERDNVSAIADAARFGVARCLESAGRSAEALDMYRYFIAQYPASRHIDAARRAERDLALFQRAPADESIPALTAVVARLADAPGSAQIDLFLGWFELESLKDFAEADRRLAAAERRGLTGDDADRAALGRALAALRIAQRTGKNRDAAAATMRAYLRDHPTGARRADAAWELWLFLRDHAAPAQAEQAARDYLATAPTAHVATVRCALGDALRLQGRQADAEKEYAAVIAAGGEDPDVGDAWYGRGLARQAAQNFTGAIEDLRAHDRLYPNGRNGAAALLALGDILVRVGQYREAAKTYEDLIARCGYSAEADSAQSRLIGAYVQAGDLDAAELRAVNAMKRAADNPFIPDDVKSEQLYRYATVMAHRKDATKAKRALQDYLAQYPAGSHIGDVYFALGQIFKDEGKTQLATTYLREAGAVPGNSRAGREAGDMLLENGRYEEAVGEYGKLASSSSRIERMYALSRIVVALYRDGKSAEAASNAEAFKKEFPDAKPTLEEFELERGKWLFKQKKWDEAADIFDELADSDTKETAGMGLYWTARVHEAKNENKKAESKFQDVVKEYPGTEAAMEAALTLGRMAMRAEKYDVAAGFFKTVVDAAGAPQGTLKEALNGIITAYDQLDMYDAAIEMTRRFITLYPNDPTVFRKRVNMGEYYYQLRYFDQAVAQLQALLPEASQDDQAEIRYYIGENYFYMGDYTQAALEFLKVPYLVVNRTEIDWRALAYSMAGQSYEKLSRYDSALEMYRKILELKDADARDRAAAEKEINRLKDLIK